MNFGGWKSFREGTPCIIVSHMYHSVWSTVRIRLTSVFLAKTALSLVTGSFLCALPLSGEVAMMYESNRILDINSFKERYRWALAKQIRKFQNPSPRQRPVWESL